MVGFVREDSAPGGGSGTYDATMGSYSSYGTVFTGATVVWPRVLNEWDTGADSRSIPQLWSAPPNGIGGDGHPPLPSAAGSQSLRTD
jgi:hypothetical protein